MCWRSESLRGKRKSWSSGRVAGVGPRGLLGTPRGWGCAMYSETNRMALGTSRPGRNQN